MGHARALLGLSDPEQLVTLAHKAVAQKLSVRETERCVGRIKAASAERLGSGEPKSNPHVRQVIEELQRVLGTKVRLIEKGGRGRLEIDFFSQEDLDRLLMQLRR
jgi:ParB family chromosome partitioning protein